MNDLIPAEAAHGFILFLAVNGHINPDQLNNYLALLEDYKRLNDLKDERGCFVKRLILDDGEPLFIGIDPASADGDHCATVRFKGDRVLSPLFMICRQDHPDACTHGPTPDLDSLLDEWPEPGTMIRDSEGIVLYRSNDCGNDNWIPEEIHR